MNAAIVDTDVVSMLFKGDTRRLLTNRTSQVDCLGSPS
jgi:predicted nucleic acid-binding protein